jgi:hypothetical protein
MLLSNIIFWKWRYYVILQTILVQTASSSRRYRKVLGRNAEYASAAIWNIVFHHNITTSTTTAIDPQCNNIALHSDMLLLPSKDDIENDSEDDEVQFIKIRRNAISTNDVCFCIFCFTSEEYVVLRKMYR